MQNDLDPKGFEAAKAAATRSWESEDMAWSTALAAGIRAYLSAVPDGEGELPAGSLRGVVPHSIRVAAEDLANEVWSDLDEIRTKTRLTDAWGVIAEACGDDIIRFAAGISPALAASRLSQAGVRGSHKFKLGDRVTKTKGSSWTGHVVGFYSTELTPVGYAVESENEPGSVQIYPEAALSGDTL